MSGLQCGFNVCCFGYHFTSFAWPSEHLLASEHCSSPKSATTASSSVVVLT